MQGLIQDRKLQKGFSLMEALIVIGLVAVLVAIVLPAFYRALQKYRAETAVEQIAINLRFARLSAVKKRIDYKLVFTTNSYKMQTSTDGVSYTDYNHVDTQLPNNLSILSGGCTEVVYSPRGSASMTGGSTIRIQSLSYGGGSGDIIYRITLTGAGGVTKTAE
jgi:prepilin-type N-terminal cleavage/methylation domain-containing protein